jgi:hypothetical protein
MLASITKKPTRIGILRGIFGSQPMDPKKPHHKDLEDRKVFELLIFEVLVVFVV